ncbi:MAG: Ig-like domain-containing protein, partial [Ilumatobacteraceae bacterium]
MIDVRGRWIRRVAVSAVIALIGGLGGVGVGPTRAFAVPPITPVPLGLASSFAVLTPAAVGNTATGPVTTLRGDLGAGGGTTGFPPGVYTGTLYTGAAANPALADLTIAYANATSRPAGLPLAPDLLGVTVGPGVHTNSAAVANTGTFTIDAGGDPNAVFIFQVGGALSMAAGSHVVLAGQARASNVFWAVNGAGAVGANATFAGTLMATAAIAVGDGTIFNGRALSKAGAITMTSNEFYSVPPTVTINGGAAAYTTVTSPTLSGTTSVRSPATVTVTINGQTLHPIPDVNGVWTTPTGLLANGTYTVTASVIDGGGNTGSFAQQLTVDTSPPAITIDGGTSVTTNDLTPTFTGTTDVDPGRLVTFAVVGATSSTGSAVVQIDQTWNISPSGFAQGHWTVTATVTDPAGNSNSASQDVTIDTAGLEASITSPPLTNDSTPTITGTAGSGSTVDVTVDGGLPIGVVLTGTIWSMDYTGTPLTDGSHNVSVFVTKVSSNPTTVRQSLTIDTIAPTLAITPGPTDPTNDQTPTISGTTDAPAGVRVSVTIDAGPAMLAFVQAGGSWNVTPSAQVAPGVVTVVASVADQAGNVRTYSQQLTIDVTPPVVVINGGPSRTTADATPTIAGTVLGAAIGSIVDVTVAGQALTTTLTSSSTWSVTAATIANGTQVVFVTAADAAGNIGNANQSLTLNAVIPLVTIDGGPMSSTNDSTPQIAGDSTAAIGSDVVVTVAGQTLHATVQPGGSWNVTAAAIANSTVTVGVTVTDLDGNIGSTTQSLTVNTAGFATITITGGATRATNDSTPTISGTTDAGNGRVLTVVVGGQIMWPVAAGGRWSTTAAPLGDGTYAVSVILSASGGSSGSASQLLTIDTVVPVVIIPGGGTVTTTNPTPPITGTGAQPGATVTVTVAGETLTTVVAADGTWSVTPTVPLGVGAHVVVVTIVDAAGNVGTGSQIITVAAAPGTPGGTGDFVSVGPKRVFDTRPGLSPGAMRQVAKTQIGGAIELRVQLTNLPGLVPATGVSAVSLNVTATGSRAAGYITLYACGTRELVSSVNFTAGSTVANAVITPLSASGDVCFFANTPTDVIVDVNGWFATGAAFNAVGPKRLFDTRAASAADTLRAVPKTKIAAGGVLEVMVTDIVGFVPTTGVSAVSLNVVVTNPDFAGYVTVYACGTRALVSSVNYVAGSTVANAVITPVSATGTVCFYSLAGVDLVVDINGWLSQGSGFVAAGPARVADTRPGESPEALRSVPKARIGGTNILEL